MPEAVITIDIAAAVKAGIESAVTSSGVKGVTVRVEPDRARTNYAEDGPTRPLVAARVHDLFNHDFAQDSKLRECNVTIQVQTDYADDPGQVTLSTLAHYVAAWILSPPTLSLTSCTFRRMSLPEPPRRDETDGRVQFVEWNAVVGVFVT